jgi:hypothetical protein
MHLAAVCAAGLRASAAAHGFQRRGSVVVGFRQNPTPAPLLSLTFSRRPGAYGAGDPVICPRDGDFSPWVWSCGRSQVPRAQDDVDQAQWVSVEALLNPDRRVCPVGLWRPVRLVLSAPCAPACIFAGTSPLLVRARGSVLSCCWVSIGVWLCRAYAWHGVPSPLTATPPFTVTDPLAVAWGTLCHREAWSWLALAVW